MATVYKVEIEIVSDRVNYHPENLKEILRYLIEINNSIKDNDIRVSEIEVERKS